MHFEDSENRVKEESAPAKKQTKGKWSVARRKAHFRQRSHHVDSKVINEFCGKESNSYSMKSSLSNTSIKDDQLEKQIIEKKKKMQAMLNSLKDDF